MENGKGANFLLEWETKGFLEKSLIWNILSYIQVFLLFLAISVTTNLCVHDTQVTVKRMCAHVIPVVKSGKHLQVQSVYVAGTAAVTATGTACISC